MAYICLLLQIDYGDLKPISLLSASDLAILNTPEKAIFQKPKLRTIDSLSEIDYLASGKSENSEEDPFTKPPMPAFVSLTDIVGKSVRTGQRLVKVKRFGDNEEKFLPLPELIGTSHRISRP